MHSDFLNQRDLILLISGRMNVEGKDSSAVCSAFPDGYCIPTPVWWLSYLDENP